MTFDSGCTRRDFLRMAGIGTAGAVLAPSWLRAHGDVGGRPPNIIVCMVDDMGFSDLGCFGSEIRTPNLDRLAQNGVRLTAMHNVARCCPSRASLLTGLHPTQTGIGTFIASNANDRSMHGPGYSGVFNRPFVTLAEVLGASGYATGLSGKWHLGPKESLQRGGFQGTDHLFVGGAGSYWPGKDDRGATWTYRTEEIADKAVAFASASMKSGKPFFLYWTPTAPHWPYDVLATDKASYDGAYEAGPQAVWQARVKRQRQMGILQAEWPTPEPEGLDQREPGPRAALRTSANQEKTKPASYGEWMEAYAGMVTCMDRGVGRMLAALEEAGQLDNTLFIFLSDNGACEEPQSYGPGWATASNAPFRMWKMHTHAGGIATGAIIHWPKAMQVKPGGIDQHPWHIVDIMPTVLDVAGIQRPGLDAKGRPIPAADGISLLPLLRGDLIPPRGPLCFEHKGNWAVIDGGWKLVGEGKAKGGGHEFSLYDYAKDRAESRNVAAQHPDQVARLRGLWEAWAKRVEANDVVK